MTVNSAHSSWYQLRFIPLWTEGLFIQWRMWGSTEQLKPWLQDLSVHVIWGTHGPAAIHCVLFPQSPVVPAGHDLPFSVLTAVLLLLTSTWSLLSGRKFLILLLFSDYWRHQCILLSIVCSNRITAWQSRHRGEIIIIVTNNNSSLYLLSAA